MHFMITLSSYYNNWRYVQFSLLTEIYHIRVEPDYFCKKVHPSKVVGDYETNFSNGRVNLESTIASARPFGVIATVTLASFNTDIRYSSDFHLVNAGQ